METEWKVIHDFVYCKLRAKLFLCLIKHHAMKNYWEWRYSSTLS